MCGNDFNLHVIASLAFSQFTQYPLPRGMVVPLDSQTQIVSFHRIFLQHAKNLCIKFITILKHENSRKGGRARRDCKKNV